MQEGDGIKQTGRNSSKAIPVIIMVHRIPLLVFLYYIEGVHSSCHEEWSCGERFRKMQHEGKVPLFCANVITYLRGQLTGMSVKCVYLDGLVGDGR